MTAQGTAAGSGGAAERGPLRRGALRVEFPLVALAAASWWVSVRSPMPAALPAFLLGWLVMMAAMMLPAVAPVVLLYQRAARRGTVAPVGLFVAGYLAVWTAVGVPAYLAWRWVQPAVMDGRPWAGRLAGGTLLLAAAYQLTPLKDACLRNCRSPLSAFTTVRGSLSSAPVALRVGARNGLWCLGCCWALMAVLVAVGVMQPWWMAGIAALIFIEKALPRGLAARRPLSLLLVVPGVLLLADPALLMTYTTH